MLFKSAVVALNPHWPNMGIGHPVLIQLTDHCELYSSAYTSPGTKYAEPISLRYQQMKNQLRTTQISIVAVESSGCYRHHSTPGTAESLRSAALPLPSMTQIG